MTVVEYAKHRGVTEPGVRKALRDGRIGLRDDGMIDVDEADADWEANTNPAKQRGRPPATTGGSMPPYAVSRAAKEYHAARKQRLDTDFAEGRLTDAGQAEAAWADVGAFVLQEVGSIPMRVTNRLPDEWRKEVYKILTEETRRVLASISDEFVPDEKAA